MTNFKIGDLVYVCPPTEGLFRDGLEGIYTIVDVDPKQSTRFVLSRGNCCSDRSFATWDAVVRSHRFIPLDPTTPLVASHPITYDNLYVC